MLSQLQRAQHRRVALLAKSLDMDLTIEHDHGLLLHLNTITATGPTPNVREFHRRILRVVAESSLSSPRGESEGTPII